MKKWLWIIVSLVAVMIFGRSPSAGMDVGKLKPVQVVCLGRSDGNVIIWTDTGDWGSGPDLNDAVEDMRTAASGEIFLETADHLLLMPDCVNLLEDTAGLFRPSCSICLLDGEPDIEQIGQFLEIHSPNRTLMEYRAGLKEMQTLKITEGKMCLVS